MSDKAATDRKSQASSVPPSGNNEGLRRRRKSRSRVRRRSKDTMIILEDIGLTAYQHVVAALEWAINVSCLAWESMKELLGYLSSGYGLFIFLLMLCYAIFYSVQPGIPSHCKIPGAADINPLIYSTPRTQPLLVCKIPVVSRLAPSWCSLDTESTRPKFEETPYSSSDKLHRVEERHLPLFGRAVVFEKLTPLFRLPLVDTLTKLVDAFYSMRQGIRIIHRLGQITSATIQTLHKIRTDAVKGFDRTATSRTKATEPKPSLVKVIVEYWEHRETRQKLFRRFFEGPLEYFREVTDGFSERVSRIYTELDAKLKRVMQEK